MAAVRLFPEEVGTETLGACLEGKAEDAAEVARSPRPVRPRVSKAPRRSIRGSWWGGWEWASSGKIIWDLRWSDGAT